MKKFLLSTVIEAKEGEDALREACSQLEISPRQLIDNSWSVVEITNEALASLHVWEERSKRATKTLTHYFRQVFIKADLGWDGDNDVEILGAVEDLMEPKPKGVG